MDIVINGGTAGIDFDFARSYGLKLLFFRDIVLYIFILVIPFVLFFIFGF